MKNTKTLGTVEKVTLGEIEFADDSIQVWIDIKYVSSNLHSKILHAMEEAKKQSAKTMQELYGREWNETEVKTLTLNIMLFFTLFTTSCCTLFTTVFEIVTAVSAHYSIPIMHIKYSYQETKHII